MRTKIDFTDSFQLAGQMKEVADRFLNRATECPACNGSGYEKQEYYHPGLDNVIQYRCTTCCGNCVVSQEELRAYLEQRAAGEEA